MLRESIIILLTSKFVGVDSFGNKYYENKRKNKRYVIYKGLEEASKVTAEWHGWLHYSNDAPLLEREKYFWEKPFLPNLTNTVLSYSPYNKDKNWKRYQSWSPKNDER